MKSRTELTLTHVEHTFQPIFDENSRILILGTFPSVKSRETDFYYGHPRNRFWRLLADITGNPQPDTIEDKKKMLLGSGIAVWDVVQSCDIHGSSDSSITNVVPADIKGLLAKTGISKIYANGGTAESLYKKYCLGETGVDIVKLPSTSPANAGYSYERLMEKWKVIADNLDR